MSLNRGFLNLLSDVDVADFIELLDGMIALLDSDGSAVWCNRRWRRDLEIDPSIARPSPSHYYTGSRLAEFNQLLARSRAGSRTIAFYDVWRGERHRTVLHPLAGDRVLFLSNPSLLVPGELPFDGDADIVEIRHKEWGPLARLTDREREILSHLASGRTVKVIAESLERSQKTVEGHRDSIYRKLDANSRVILTLLAVRAGLASPTPPVASHDQLPELDESH
ncbi:MAG: LuxR C-terminal-related transcriptional regulator [Planctomycetota bacterium]|nr:LuxR C-terminal-related transcriptional regulator [Planctomycetota bacterium]